MAGLNKTKLILIAILLGALAQSGAFAQSLRSGSQLGIGFNLQLDQMLEVSRSDFKKAEITDNYKGFNLFYTTEMTDAFSFQTTLGQQTRFSSLKFFPEDARNTTVNEEVFFLQLGLSNYFRKIWGVAPFSTFNLTYYSMNVEFKNIALNSDAMTVDKDTILDEKINVSIFSPTFIFGFDMPFKYAGVKFFTEVFPETFIAEGTLGSNDRFNYAYKFKGYNLGIGFFAYI